MRATEVARLVGIQRGVNAAEHDIGASGSRRGTELVAAQGVAGMDADADDVTLVDDGRVEGLERFVDERGRPVLGRCR